MISNSGDASRNFISAASRPPAKLIARATIVPLLEPVASSTSGKKESVPCRKIAQRAQA